MKQTMSPRLQWFDALRGLAILGILFYHFTVDSIPTAGGTHGVGAVQITGPLAVVQDLAILGQQGVLLLVVISGAGLVFAGRRGQSSPRDFYQKHFRRLLTPYYLGLVALFIGLVILAAGRAWHFERSWLDEMLTGAQLEGRQFDLTAGQFWAWLLIVPRLVVTPVTSTWFVVLIAQLYLLFPLLRWLLRRLGRGWFLVLSLTTLYVSFGLMGVASSWHHGSLVGYAIGFLHLGEFCIGMILGQTLGDAAKRPWWIWAFIGACLWLGAKAGVLPMWALYAALGTGLFFLGLPMARSLENVGPLTWIGRHSLEVFMIQDVFRFAIGSWPWAGSWFVVWPYGFVFFGLAVVAAAGGLLHLDRRIFSTQRPGH